MIDDTTETPAAAEKFDNSQFPENTLFHDRRGGPDRRERFGAKADVDGRPPRVPKERREKKERRRRIDPTTFEKQYTGDELEFMNAMQQFKVQSCKTFPTYGEVLRVAMALGYRKAVTVAADDEPDSAEIGTDSEDSEPSLPIDLSASHSDGQIL
jgi:hypothetical protein